MSPWVQRRLIAAVSSISSGKHHILKQTGKPKLVLTGCVISEKSSVMFDYVLSFESFGG